MAPWYDCREVNSVFKQVCEKSTSKVTYTSECQKKNINHRFGTLNSARSDTQRSIPKICVRTYMHLEL